MTNQISVKDMLTMMETGDPFSLTYVTYDRQRKKGGRTQEYTEAVLMLKPKEEEQSPTLETRQPTEIEAKREKLQRLKKVPNHFKWYTRNIQLLVNGHPTGERRKIHPPLVVLFNNKIVVA